jgi:hypothetical protein
MSDLQFLLALCAIGGELLLFIGFSRFRRLVAIVYFGVCATALVLCIKYSALFAGYIVYSAVLTSLIAGLLTARAPLLFQDKPATGGLAIIYNLVLLLILLSGADKISRFSLDLFAFSVPLGVPFGFLAYYVLIAPKPADHDRD